MRRLIIMAAILLPVLALLSLNGVAAAAPICGQADTSSKGLVLTGAGQVDKVDCSGDSATKLTNAVVQILSQIVGVLAVIMVIWAGFKYITSGGDSNKIASAKTTLIYALIGLVVVALAQIVVHFAINTATGAVATPTCPAGTTLASDGVCR